MIVSVIQHRVLAVLGNCWQRNYLRVITQTKRCRDASALYSTTIDTVIDIGILSILHNDLLRRLEAFFNCAKFARLEMARKRQTRVHGWILNGRKMTDKTGKNQLHLLQCTRGQQHTCAKCVCSRHVLAYGMVPCGHSTFRGFCAEAVQFTIQYNVCSSVQSTSTWPTVQYNVREYMG